MFSPTSSPDVKLIIGLGSRAKVGKDYAATTLINKYGPQNVRRVAFADELKADVFDLLWTRTGINPYVCTPEEKEIVRPMLVAYGEMMRQINPSYWVDKVFQKLPGMDEAIILISDCRYPDEIDALKGRGGFYIDIDADVPPANDSEARNSPLCRSRADRVLKNNKDAKFAEELIAAVESL